MTPQEVEAIWNEQLAKVKPYLKDGRVEPKPKDVPNPNNLPEWPDLWPGYAYSVNGYNARKVHIENGCNGDRLFLQRAPNQTDEELAYVKANFKQTTLPIFKDVENTFGRALDDSNWQVTYTQDANGTDFQEYITTQIDEFDNAVDYWRSVLPKQKILDPMGLICTHPKRFDVVADEQTGETFINPDTKVEPQYHYFECFNVWGFKYDNWYLVRKRENSPVQHGNRTEMTGVVCWFFDSEATWRITQVGKKTDWRFEIVKEFAQNVGYPPCTHLRGDPVLIDGRLVWGSPYDTIQDLLDIALMDAQYLQVSKNTCVYPYRVMIGDDCDYFDKAHEVQCHDGRLVFSDDNGAAQYLPCPSCKGTGKRSRLSPMGALIIRPQGTDGSAAEVNNTGQAMYFVAPGTETLEFIRKEVVENETRARRIMHLESENALMSGGEAVTATEKGLDHKASIAFRKPIVDQLFTVLDFMLDSAQKMRYGTEVELYTLVQPTNLDIRTVDDLMLELEKVDKLPPAFADGIIWQYGVSRFGSNPKTLDAFEAIAAADRLMPLPWSQIQAGVSGGTIQPWEVVLHYSAMFIYDKLFRTEASFANLDVDAKAEKMKAAAEALAPQQAPTSPLDAIRKVQEARKAA